jgi:hypothetical protein
VAGRAIESRWSGRTRGEPVPGRFMDLFHVYAYQDEAFASDVADRLESRGLKVGRALSLCPGMRLLAHVDRGTGLATP